jgi:cell division septation protein DedD
MYNRKTGLYAMEKIQIQFKESDYKIYYDYCLKYYQVHDPVRKQSIYAFLDLFKKGILPVDAQDIQQAKELLSERCTVLKKGHDDAGRRGDTAIPLQMRMCDDLLLLTNDLEKIYRLIQKLGIDANYVMILGTFSNIIAEAKDSYRSALYEVKSDVVESLARPLAESIRMRLGTDRQWQSALRELTVIATRFNQRFPEPKFDLDIIRIVAPAVVSNFNRDVKASEILSLLPSYYGESELEEFEAFLNRTPDFLRNELDADIDWDAIAEPLKVVAAEVADQREKWSQGSSKLSDPFSPVSPPGISSPDGVSAPSGIVSSSFPGQPQENRHKAFAIAVNPDVTSRVESPGTVYPVPDTSALKIKIQPFIPVIIGVAVIILFIVGTMVVSGDWNPLGGGNVTNSSSVTVKTTTTVKPAATTAKPAATTAKPAATTAKPAATTATPTATSTPKIYSYADIGNHFLEIAFGPDNNVIQKSTKDRLTISCQGVYDATDITLIKDFIKQFNDYSTTTKIAESVDINSPADIALNFLPDASLKQIKSDPETFVNKNLETGTYYFVSHDTNTYVNSELKGDERKQWVLRAILYNLGFLGETAKYSDSLFYTGTNKVTRLSDIDLKALQLMYGKKINNGMTRSSAKTIAVG